MPFKSRNPRREDKKHLDFIRQLPCLLCGNNIQTEAAHVRMRDPSIAKPEAPYSAKPHDMFTVPLCNAHHREQHDFGNEREWWKSQGIDPVKVSLALYAESGNYEIGLRIVAAQIAR